MPENVSSPNSQKFISRKRTARRYDKSERTITRWSNDPKLGFPQPTIINGRWSFESAKLDNFDRSLAVARLRAIADSPPEEAAVEHDQCAQIGSREADVKNAQCKEGDA